MGSISVYVISFLLSAGLCRLSEKTIYKNKERKRGAVDLFVYLMVIAPVLVIAAIRSTEVGADTINYTNDFYLARRYTSFTDYFLFKKEDILHSFLMYICSKLTKEPYSYFAMIQLLILGPLMYLGFRKDRTWKVWQVLYVYLFVFFNDSLNVGRQLTAVVFMMLGYQLLQERKVWKAAVMFGIAVGFHSSSILVIPVFFVIWLVNRFPEKKLFQTAFISGFILMVFVADSLFQELVRSGILPRRYIFYINTFIFQNTRLTEAWTSLGKGAIFEIGFRVMVILLGMIAVLWLHRSGQKEEKKVCEQYLFVFTVGMLIYFLGVAVYHTTYVVRFSVFFDIYILYLLPLIDQAVPLKIKIDHRNIPYCTISIAVLYWVIHVLVLGSGGSIPYEVWR